MHTSLSSSFFQLILVFPDGIQFRAFLCFQTSVTLLINSALMQLSFIFIVFLRRFEHAWPHFVFLPSLKIASVQFWRAVRWTKCLLSLVQLQVPALQHMDWTGAVRASRSQAMTWLMFVVRLAQMEARQ